MKKTFFFTAITILLINFSSLVSAQNVAIPDANFKAALLANPNINTNLDTEIQVVEAESFYDTVNVNGFSISNLTGIEAFPYIVGLNCSNNFIVNLNVSNNTSLVYLDCSQNLIGNLDLSQNHALLYLNCNYNDLITIDLTNNLLLIDLYCAHNTITCVNVAANTELRTIVCSNNSLTALNVKNGNNTNIVTFNALTNSGLSCIQVDNPVYSISNWPYDTWNSFSVNCGQPDALFSATSPVCVGAPVVFSAMSAIGPNWYYNFGDGSTSTSQSPTYIYNTAGSYMVTFVASNCYGKDTAYTAIEVGTDIYGHVTKPGSDVTEGIAVLYPYLSWYTSFDTLQIQPLGLGGTFQFTNIEQGDYLIQVFPDTIAYPTLIPTYFDHDWAWDSSDVFTHGCTANDFINISMIELPFNSPNIGYIQGFVIEGPGFGRNQGDPVHGVVVKRGITGSNTIVESTLTSETGEFSFSNVDFGNYTIYVDIPGLERDSTYDVIVDGSTNQFLNLYYVVDSVSIYIVQGIGIEDIESNENSQMKIYPNPVQDMAVLDYAINVDADVQIDLYNMMGVKLQNLVSTNLSIGEYNYLFNPKHYGLKAGMYLISLTADGRTKTLRVIVTE